MRISDWSSDVCSSDLAANAAYAAANAGVQGPQQRVLKYDKVLPNVGFTYNFTPVVSMFANYSKWLQVPGTDNLYNSFFFAPGTDAAHPNPETTDNFDAGVRYTSSKVQAQISGWRSEASRVGKEWGSTCRSRFSPSP